jgi:hypothetical protein
VYLSVHSAFLCFKQWYAILPSGQQTIFSKVVPGQSKGHHQVCLRSRRTPWRRAMSLAELQTATVDSAQARQAEY